MPEEQKPIAPQESADAKTETIKKILENMRDSIATALSLLDVGPKQIDNLGEFASKQPSLELGFDVGFKVVEGVFDGEQMIGSDGGKYSVPANYASKSKLVEGDLMKLTIKPNGAFLFKQIGPIERERKVGQLAEDPDSHEYGALVGSKLYRILKASVSYYKGSIGDEVILLVPKNNPSRWAAVDNIIKRA